MRYTLVALLFMSATVLLFQNCELTTAVKGSNLVLPTDVSIIEPYHSEFSETQSMQKTYRVSFDLNLGEASAQMIEGSVISGPSECDFTFALNEDQIRQIKTFVGSLELCAKTNEDDSRYCTGSCPRNGFIFYSDTLLRSGAPVQNGWVDVMKNKLDAGNGNLYFCGGHERLFDYLRVRVAENIPPHCPQDFPILF